MAGEVLLAGDLDNSAEISEEKKSQSMSHPTPCACSSANTPARISGRRSLPAATAIPPTSLQEEHAGDHKALEGMFRKCPSSTFPASLAGLEARRCIVDG
mmetsp:Transcript_39968/g.64016  ORF Transcript_39968/g.64016 Transcript_39968/m.64016 type:complete len:100 (+) Transcript_39968:31-330(+)|eukprot:CAMPEP_0169197348 /NCGR_PEP_ID=MMETSP1016-20121227/8222_1 /TAXON_ID=342587 /ORGANISM="Karlodinium micrum, Strain CCMP2283" /LENGTH=99 /DNA_ID=CAMNT_0009273993 /DNA_START=134 /DNA_END=433 /DNA_ORIENTATION=+